MPRCSPEKGAAITKYRNLKYIVITGLQQQQHTTEYKYWGLVAPYCRSYGVIPVYAVTYGTSDRKVHLLP